MKKKISSNFSKHCLLLLFSLSTTTVFSQGLKITPTARFLFDGGKFHSKDVPLTDGVVVRDFRLGLKGTYNEFNFKADVSLSQNKVSLKDVFLQYNINKTSFVRGGHYTVPFGLQSAYGSADKEYLSDPSSNIFQIGRRVGIMHSVWNKRLWLSYGAFADGSAVTQSTDVSGKQGYVLAERFVYKPIVGTDKLLQVGFSYNHVRAESNSLKPKLFKYSTPYLTGVDKTKAVDAVIDDARYENKYTFELAGFYKSFALESQYYGSRIERNGGKNAFDSNGYYIAARGIILNRADYQYSEASAGICNPRDKALELTVGYGSLNMNDANAAILGGKMDDVSVGLAFYWNKHVTIRANYSHIVVTKPELPNKEVDALQCRIQYVY